MTKLGIMADSHRAWKNIQDALPSFEGCAYIIHLGDHESDMDDFPEVSSRLISVGGNCDFFSSKPARRIFTVEGVKLLVCHGHAYGVKRGLDELAVNAKREGCALALYGHTHEKRDTSICGVRLINPGALKNGNFAVLTIDGDTVKAEFMTV